MGLVARYSHPHFSHSFTACRTRPSRSTSLSWTHGRPSFARTGFARWRLVSSGRSLQSAGARKGSTTTSPATLSLKSTSTWSGPTGRPGTASSITRRKRMHNRRPTHPGKTYSDARGKEDTTSRVSGLAFTLLMPHALVARQAGAWNGRRQHHDLQSTTSSEESVVPTRWTKHHLALDQSTAFIGTLAMQA